MSDVQCATCQDRGTVFIRSETPNTHTGSGVYTWGRVIDCPHCDIQSRRMVETCWELGDLERDPPIKRTFESFTPYDATTRTMFAAASKFAANPTGWLTFHGNGNGAGQRSDGHHGCGKTHLAHAVGRALLRRNVPTLYISAARLFERLGACWRDPDTDYAKRMEWTIALPVLIVDELNKEKNVLGAQDDGTVFRLRQQVLDARYERALAGIGGATMLLSNDKPEVWHDPAIASRARDSRFSCIETTAVDYRRREKAA